MLRSLSTALLAGALALAGGTRLGAQSADLAIGMTDAPDPVNFGANVTYALLVTNLGPSAATGVMVTNTIPAGFSFVSANINLGTTVTTQKATVVTYTNTVWKNEQSGGDLGTAWTAAGYDDAAWLSGRGPLGYETGAVPVPINTTMLLTNTANGVRPITYYLRTTFAYTNATTNTTMTLRYAIDDGMVVYVNGQELFRDTNMPTGTITYTTQARAAHSENQRLTNRVAVTNLVTGINTLAVEVHQNGATSSDIYFALDADIEAVSGGVGASYTVIGSNVVFTLGDLAASNKATLTVVARADVFGAATNTARVQAATTDPNGANNTAQAVTTVNPPTPADLTLGVVDNPDPIQTGNPLAYTIYVTNAGPSWATNVMVTNVLPAGVSFVSATIANAGQVTQITTYVTMTNVWKYNQEGLDLGTNWVESLYDDSAWPTGAALLALESLALQYPKNTPLVFNNGAGDRIHTHYFRTTFDYAGPTLAVTSQVSILVDDGAVVYLNGKEIWRTPNMGTGVITYTNLTTAGANENVVITTNLVLTNLVTGTNVLAAEVHQTDATSSDVVFGMSLQRTQTGRGLYEIIGNEAVFKLGNLPNGIVSRIDMVVTPNIAGTLTNTFVGGSTVFDNNLANNRVVATTLVSSEPVGADLAVSITDTPDPVIQGQDLTYNVTVRNLGPAPAVNTRLTNYLSPSVTLVSASPGCALAGSQVICNLGTLAVSGQSNIAVVVRPSLVGVVTNLATTISDTVDVAISNNAALASTIVLTSLRADLQVTVVSRPAPATAGELFTNVVTVYNAGPSNAPSVVLTNQLAGLFVLNGVQINGPGTVNNQGGGRVVCSLGDLAAGGSVSVEFAVQAVSAGTITNTASVRSTIFDPDANNSTVVATTRVNPAPVVDLAVGVAALPVTIYAGEQLTYTISVTNNGTLTGTGIQLTNLLPAGLTLISLTNSQGACTNFNGMVVCNLGTLVGGAVATVTYQMVAPGSGTLTNVAGAVSLQPDFNLADNLAIHTAVVIPNTAADLNLTVVPTATNLYAGEELTYRLTLTNKGPLAASGVVITCELPVGTTYLRGNATAGSLVLASNEVRINLPTLASGAFIQASIVVRVNVHGSLTNVTTAAGEQPDPTPNVVQTVVRVQPSADVWVTVQEPPEPALSTAMQIYTITVVNSGPSTASNTTVYCYLPVVSQFGGAYPISASFTSSNGVVVWKAGHLPAGGSASLELEFVPGEISTLMLPVGVFSDVHDPVPTNNNVLVQTDIMLTLAGTDITITPTVNAGALVAGITGGTAGGLKVNNVGLQAQRSQTHMSSGLFVANSLYGTGQRLSGVILSSGDVMSYGAGRNTNSGTTFAYGQSATREQEDLLDPITGDYSHYDVTQLDIYFDVLPGYDQVTFKVIFGSEEYSEYVYSSYIDGFGIYLDGTNIAYAAGWPVNIRHPEMMEVPGTELDGVIYLNGTNPVMTFTAPVVPGSSGHKLTFILADTSDTVLDTTVYIASLAGGLGAHAELEVAASAAPDPVTVGQTLTYSLLVSNRGPDTATNTIFGGFFPDVFTNISITISEGEYTYQDGLFIWAVGDLAHRAAAVATVTGTTTFDARVIADFMAYSDVNDMNETNNVASVFSTIRGVGSFYSPSTLQIRDGASALPYPSTITVGGLTGVVDTVTVTLLGIYHSFPADLHVLVVAPDGRSVLLMSGAGGGFDAEGISLLFADFATRSLPANEPITTGVFKPTNLAPTNEFPGLNFLTAPSYATTLASLRRGNPNGDWRLYVYDALGGDAGELAGGWNVKITTVPEMSVRVVGNTVVISWHDLPGYVLEGATQISVTTLWTAVTGTPVVVGGMRSLTVPMSSGYKYFRLRK